MKAIGVEPSLLVLEPCGRGTAPIAAIATRLAAEHWPDALVLMVSADHLIADDGEFRRTVRRGAALADDWIVTLGIALWVLIPFYDTTKESGRRGRTAHYFGLIAVFALLATTAIGYWTIR